jgi:hypothetical protein
MSGQRKHLWTPTKEIQLELVSLLLTIFKTTRHLYVQYVSCLLMQTRHNHETTSNHLKNNATEISFLQEKGNS